MPIRTKKTKRKQSEAQIKKKIKKAAFVRGLALGAGFLPLTIVEGRQLFIKKGKEIKRLKAELKKRKTSKRKRRRKR